MFPVKLVIDAQLIYSTKVEPCPRLPRGACIGESPWPGNSPSRSQREVSVLLERSLEPSLTSATGLRNLRFTGNFG